MNRTIKKRFGHLRKTIKNYLKSGGARGKPLNPEAKPFVFDSPKESLFNSAALSLNSFARPVPLNTNEIISPVNTSSSVIFNEIEIEKLIFEGREIYFGSLLTTKSTNKSRAQIESAYALDCEMVGVGPIKFDDRGRPFRDSSLAHVVIVDFRGKSKYNKLVIPKEGIDEITDYRTEVSGITKEKLEELDPRKHSYRKIISEIRDILKNKIIIGHGLKSDFNVLNNYKPDNQFMVFDTAQINKYMKNNPRYGRGARKLKEITKEFVGNNIQVPGSAHNPMEDAKASLNLYRVFFNYPKVAL